MATLTYSHFGNHTRSYHRARYAIVHKKAWREPFFPSTVRNSSSIARKRKFSGRGARRLAAAH